MKFLVLFISLFFTTIVAQHKLPLDSLEIRDIQDFLRDDYGNVYVYHSKNFSLTKYDSVGKQLGRLMMTVPFNIQNVQNPLQVFLFSQNAQALKLIDQNLNEIQQTQFAQKMGYISAVYAEDLQQIWLLENSTERLLQYNFRTDNIINATPVTPFPDRVIYILVFAEKLYILQQDQLLIYTTKGELLQQLSLEEGRKIYRENSNIYIICKNKILLYHPEKGLQTIFEKDKAQLVDKNSTQYVEWKDGMFYLYNIQNQNTAIFSE